MEEGGGQFDAKCGGGSGADGAGARQNRAGAVVEADGVGGRAGERDGLSRTSETAEGAGGHLGAEGGEGGSAAPPLVVVRAAAKGHAGANDEGGCVSEVIKEEETPEATAEEGEGHLGAEDGEEGMPHAVVTAVADGYAGADDEGGSPTGVIHGHPRTAVTVKKKEGHDAADGGGRGGAAGSDGDQVFDAWKGGCFLLRAVMNWRLEHVINADLFKHKVKKIPAEFDSVGHYQDIQSVLLLEEIRACMHFGISDIARSQTYYVVSISYTGTPDVYYIDIDIHNLDGCTHIAQDGDIFFLSSHSDGEVDNMSGFFAIAMGIGRETGFQRSFHVLVSEYHKVTNFEAVRHASFLTNIMGGICLSNAITSLGRGGSAAVKSFLCIGEKAKGKCGICDEVALGEFVHPDKFNKEQISAVECIVSNLRCPHVSATELLCSPPGTGKTQVAVAVIHYLFHLRSKILVCVPREKDIPMLLQKLNELFPSLDLSTILVLNNLNGMGNCNIFYKTCLEYRAQKLYCCIYVWRSWLKEMSFLLEMKPYCQEDCDHEESGTCSKTNLAVFSLKSFQKKISELAMDLHESSQKLINIFSTISFSDSDVESINKLSTHLSDLQDLMLKDGITSSGVQRAFGFSSALDYVSEATESGNVESLKETRMTCIQSIERLTTSIQVPELEDRNAIEEFCVRHSSIIICTPSCSSLMQRLLKSNSVDILIADDASQIRETDLLIPLSITRRHVLLFGDNLNLQPMVKSLVCKEAGYASSLFERLLQLNSKKKTLTKQYVMHPSISLFVREHFYEGKLEDGCDILSDSKLLLDESKIPAYGFFDITDMDETKAKRKSFVEYATVILLLQNICAGLANENAKLNVAIICLDSSRVYTMKNKLDTKYGRHGRINLEVNSLEKLDRNWYDVVLLSLVSDDKSEVPEEKKIHTALTKARYCLWIIGEGTVLHASAETWKKLINNAKERKCFATTTGNKLSKVMKKIQMDGQDKTIAAHSALPENVMQKPGQEFTWKGRPINTKNILASLRDQKNARDTCTIQATLGVIESLNKLHCSRLEPPQDFPYDLCVNDAKSKYEKIVEKEFESEEISKRGKQRLETVFDVAKQGIIGRNKAEPEEPERLFKIESHERVNAKETEKTESLVEGGEIMIGTFRVSRNYFRLRPGEPYVYDKNIPYTHPKSGLPVAHAVMVIGHGKQPLLLEGTSTEPAPCRRHVHIQNSEGKRFGINGFGRVDRSSLRGLYRITLAPPAEQIIRN